MVASPIILGCAIAGNGFLSLFRSEILYARIGKIMGGNAYIVKCNEMLAVASSTILWRAIMSNCFLGLFVRK